MNSRSGSYKMKRFNVTPVVSPANTPMSSPNLQRRRSTQYLAEGYFKTSKSAFAIKTSPTVSPISTPQMSPNLQRRLSTQFLEAGYLKPLKRSNSTFSSTASSPRITPMASPTSTPSASPFVFPTSWHCFQKVLELEFCSINFLTFKMN